MIDSHARRALAQGIVHEARIGTYGNGTWIHPLCDPKVRWDPSHETRRKAVTCFECLVTEQWLTTHAYITIAEYIQMHQAKKLVSRG